MYLCDLVKIDCSVCPFKNYKKCWEISKEEIIEKLEDMQDTITRILSEIKEVEE